ncbi:hypothetical protein LJB98_00570 [Bacteroidales bacterium OttesenSCG-928-M11]|nr:hypothetical protein [Bacteroidales bacterium OttesenSCG-928-M11]
MKVPNIPIQNKFSIFAKLTFILNMDIIKEINTCLENLHELVYSFEEMKEKKDIDLSSIPDNLERLEQIKSFLYQANKFTSEIESKGNILTEEPVQSTISPTNPTVKVTYTDLNKAISLADRFRFAKDLFKNDMNRLDEAIDRLNKMQSFEEAIIYLDTLYAWDWDIESAIIFKEILTSRFNQQNE